MPLSSETSAAVCRLLWVIAGAMAVTAVLNAAHVLLGFGRGWADVLIGEWLVAATR